MPYQLERQLNPQTGTWNDTIVVPQSSANLLAKVLGITSLGFLITAVGVATRARLGHPARLHRRPRSRLRHHSQQKGQPHPRARPLPAPYVLHGLGDRPLIQRYLHTVGPAIVFQAAATTGVGMACMGIVAYLFQIDYRRVLGIGTALLFGLILVGLVSMFFHFLTPNTYSWLTLGVFALLTVGDFARIRAGGNGASAVVLSLSIYLDAVNIFLAILQLMSGGRRRN